MQPAPISGGLPHPSEPLLSPAFLRQSLSDLSLRFWLTCRSDHVWRIFPGPRGKED